MSVVVYLLKTSSFKDSYTQFIFSTRCNIYISRLWYDVSVHLSVTEVHWHII